MNRCFSQIRVSLMALAAVALAGCSSSSTPSDPGAAAGGPGAGGTAGAGASSGDAGGPGAGGQGGASAGSGGQGGAGGAGGAGGGGAGAGGASAATRGYNLSVLATGFTPHVGQRFAFSISRKDTSEIVASEVFPSLAMADFSLNWSGLLQKGVAYSVDYYGDLDMNGACDPPPKDHVWHRDVPAVSADVALAVGHDTQWVDVCASFATVGSRKSLTFTGAGFDVHNGQRFEIVVSRATDDVVLAHVAIDSLEAGKFTYSWDGLVETGKDYRIDYYADLNKSGGCDPPPADHVWRVPVPTVTDDTTITVGHNTNWVDVCKSFQ